MSRKRGRTQSMAAISKHLREQSSSESEASPNKIARLDRKHKSASKPVTVTATGSPVSRKQTSSTDDLTVSVATTNTNDTGRYESINTSAGSDNTATISDQDSRLQQARSTMSLHLDGDLPTRDCGELETISNKTTVMDKGDDDGRDDESTGESEIDQQEDSDEEVEAVMAGVRRSLANARPLVSPNDPDMLPTQLRLKRFRERFRER